MLGLCTFPGFVFVDDQSTVVQRLTGETGADRFGEILRSLPPASRDPRRGGRKGPDCGPFGPVGAEQSAVSWIASFIRQRTDR